MVETTSNVTHSPRLPQDPFYRLPDAEFPQLKPRRFPGQRVLIGAVFVSLGLAAIAVGATSVVYRLTHLTVGNGLINGRVVRVSAPMDGKITEFYARSGAPVRQGQLLVRLEAAASKEQTVLNLEGEIQTKSVQLEAARQSLALLNQQLQSLKQQDTAHQTVTVAIASNDVTDRTAAVTAAQAEATAARSEYERYQQLLDEGVVPAQRVEELKATWQAAEAAVEQAKAALNTAQTTQTAASDGVLPAMGDVLQQQFSLVQKIQDQTKMMQTLEQQLQMNQKKLEKAKKVESEAVAAPFSGIIYSTSFDDGEQVNRPAALLTLLDCNDLWVETLVSAEQSNQIDVDQPVRVQIAGKPETLVGSVETVEAISRAELTKKQAQALIPAVPMDLEGQPIARVVVRIPPSASPAQSHQFCGVGQGAKLTFGLHWSGL